MKSELTVNPRGLAARWGIGWYVLLLVCSAAWPVSANEAHVQDSVQAELRCVPRIGKGRVLCDVDITVKAGRITWADAIITKAPDFAPPLRDRVSMREASERSGTHLRLPFALIAQDLGTGQLTIKARAVWCKVTSSQEGRSVPRELCTSVSRTVSAAVVAAASPAQ